MEQNRPEPRRTLPPAQRRRRHRIRLVRNWTVFLLSCGAMMAVMTGGILWLLPKAYALIAPPTAFEAREYTGGAETDLSDARLVLVNGNLPLTEEPTPELAVADEATGVSLEAEAAASGDAMQAQVLKNFKSKLDRFAKRLDDLDRISVVTLQTAPQIKIIQNADQTIVDKIDTTISTTIPVWKSQMVIALGLSNQRKVLDLQNKADDVTNKLLARNAAALHKGAVDAEKANQRSVVEIDTLEKINAELIATLKETVQIQKEGEANRETAQVKMRQIESDLKNALLENAQQM